MTTDEHLGTILTHCRERLDIAMKRTPGRWCNDPLGTQCIGDISTIDAEPIAQAQSRQPLRTPSPDFERIANAQFIAACAGSAEAGWKAKIAAIALVQAVKEMCNNADISTLPPVQMILAAYPIELLKP